METPGKSIPETLLDADSQANVTVDAFTFSKLIHPLQIEFKKIPFVSSVFLFGFSMLSTSTVCYASSYRRLVSSFRKSWLKRPLEQSMGPFLASRKS